MNTAAGSQSSVNRTAAGSQNGVNRTAALTFEKPGMIKRMRGMLGVDLYRLFHTPLLYIFLAISAIIPALILSMGGDEAAMMYDSTWEIIAANEPIYMVSDMGEYANMNMVFIFGGIMVSIFIGHDYKSGYVKQLFTTHSHKMDYMVSKTLTCAFAMAGMCVTYLAGSVFAGLLTGVSFQVNAASLLIAIVGKMVMSLGWASLYAFLNIIFRRYFGISIASSFVIGTGVPIIAAAAVFGESALLNLFLYGSSVSACLAATPAVLLTCLEVSLAWTVIYNLLGTFVLSRCDVY